jgi:DNA-binding transcriptional MocR family regulator
MPNDHTHVALTWRTRFYLSSDDWPPNGPLVSGRHRSSFRMLRAGMALADEAAADGRLRGKNDWWPLKHLAERMHVSRNTAREVLQWLEESGWLVVTPQPRTSERRAPDMRRLVVPKVQQSISPLHLEPKEPASKSEGLRVQFQALEGPISGTPGPNGHIQTLGQSVDTELRSYVEPDVANATNSTNNGHVSVAITTPATMPARHPQEVLDEIRRKSKSAA